jgi:predicted kinase
MINTNMIVQNIIDLQEVVSDYSKQKCKSLSNVVAHLLRLNLNKTKELQAGDWENRPLTLAQLKYAATDVVILHELYLCLKNTHKLELCPFNIYVDTSDKLNSRKQDDFDPKIPVNIVAAGIFLSESSKCELFKNISKPYYKNIYGNCLVLKHNPTKNDIANTNIKIGQSVVFNVIDEVRETNTNTQYVNCTYNGQNYKIIISTDTEKDQYTEFIEKNTQNTNKLNIQLYGTIGIIVQTILTNPLDSLSEKIRTKILNFVETNEINSSLKFRPNELSSLERALIHEYAEGINIISESSGPPDNRKLELKIKRRTDNFVHPNRQNKTNLVNEPERRKIIDPYRYSILNISTTDIKTNPDLEYNLNTKIDGKILKSDIEFKAGSLIRIKEKNMFVLRGLVGSGKSHLATILKTKLTDALICSADSYLKDYYTCNNANIGVDIKTQIDDAHNNCFLAAINAIHTNVSNIIIDNTNSKLVHYKKYIELGKENGYNIHIFEIYCKDKSTAVDFAKRNQHKVGVKDVLKMLSQWETNDEAVIFAPCLFFDNSESLYENTNHDMPINSAQGSFNKWLSDNNVYHFNKLRRKTHILFGIGEKNVVFLDVAPHLYNEFLNQYALSGIHADDNAEPKYLTEIAQYDETVETEFKLFFDIDYVDREALNENQIVKIVQILQRHIQKSTVYVTGLYPKNNNTNFETLNTLNTLSPDDYIDIVPELEVEEKEKADIKTGLHLKCANVVTNAKNAIKTRKLFVSTLQTEIPEKNWDTIVDSRVYICDRGIRMFGSRKTAKGIDLNRMYKLLFAIDENGQKFNPQFESDVELLKAVSIHI